MHCNATTGNTSLYISSLLLICKVVTNLGESDDEVVDADGITRDILIG